MAETTEENMFRSSDMSLVQLYMSNEIGREVVTALGQLGLVHFRDLNEELSAFQRTYTDEIRRLDNVERQLRYFKSHMEKAEIGLRKLDIDNDDLATPTTTDIDDVVERSQALEQRIQQLNDSYETLKRREVELIEWRHVLREAGNFFDRAHGDVDTIRASTEDDDAPLLQDVETHRSDPDVERSFQGMNIGFVAGVIPRAKVDTFERILWRTLRGNLYMNQAEIKESLVDPANNEKVDKNVFVIFAHGREILAKIRKISESMGAEIYNVDENSDLRRDQVHEVNARLGDVQNVLENTSTALSVELNGISQSLSAWMVIIAKEKSVYSTLNLFSYDRARRTLIAEGWCPKSDISLIKSTLQDVTNRAGLSIPSVINEVRTNKTPPTFIRTTKFTEAFQTVVNAYGTATYHEVNPAIPVIVTFPFLFAVMFGDIGHAIIMLLAALAMIYWEKPLKKVEFELFAMLFYGRYIALVMAMFSIFTGLMYNDMFSLSLTILPSAWAWKTQPGMDNERVVGELPGSYRYPFGLDHMWHGADNDLLFTNSYKMKMAIVLGWAHMSYSLCFQYVNARFFKKKENLYGNFMPGMIFFQAIFGYLAICIVYKWSVDWSAPEAGAAPSLLNMLIYMFLQPGYVEDPLYRGQKYVQVALLLIAFAQVPVMLCVKPYLIWKDHKKTEAKGYRAIGETGHVVAAEDDEHDGGGSGAHDRNGNHSLDLDDEDVPMITENIHEGGGEDEHAMSEIIIHQIIHTIEFCLGTVSHTASYLRLWALSLAHQQLSIVLWNMTLGKTLGMMTGILGGVVIVIAFGMWFVLTIAVLVMMEGTSAMLHSLRLAWVESFTKFAEFEGWSFVPFSFKILLEESEDLKDYIG